jgi:hypothetical protein
MHTEVQVQGIKITYTLDNFSEQAQDRYNKALAEAINERERQRVQGVPA